MTKDSRQLTRRDLLEWNEFRVKCLVLFHYASQGFSHAHDSPESDGQLPQRKFQGSRTAGITANTSFLNGILKNGLKPLWTL